MARSTAFIFCTSQDSRSCCLSFIRACTYILSQYINASARIFALQKIIFFRLLKSLHLNKRKCFEMSGIIIFFAYSAIPDYRLILPDEVWSICYLTGNTSVIPICYLAGNAYVIPIFSPFMT